MKTTFTTTVLVKSEFGGPVRKFVETVSVKTGKSMLRMQQSANRTAVKRVFASLSEDYCLFDVESAPVA